MNMIFISNFFLWAYNYGRPLLKVLTIMLSSHHFSAFSISHDDCGLMIKRIIITVMIMIVTCISRQRAMPLPNCGRNLSESSIVCSLLLCFYCLILQWEGEFSMWQCGTEFNVTLFKRFFFLLFEIKEIPSCDLRVCFEIIITIMSVDLISLVNSLLFGD